MRRSWSLLWLIVACATCVGQIAPSDVSDIAAHAAIIFRGRVLGVVSEPSVAPDEVVSLRITFQVDDGVRGVKTGDTLTIRQWNTGADQYRAGESLVLFLYAPSALGFTSPVGGAAGHRRPDEISSQSLDEVRTPAVVGVDESAPRVVPPRRSKKLPPRAVREREVQQ